MSLANKRTGSQRDCRPKSGAKGRLSATIIAKRRLWLPSLTIQKAVVVLVHEDVRVNVHRE